MSIELIEDLKILVVNLMVKFSKEDYEGFIPELESLIKAYGKMRMLVQMRDFHDWMAGALRQNVKFHLKHFRDIERLALVGEKSWEHGMAVFCKPFTVAAIRYFNHREADRATAWIQA